MSIKVLPPEVSNQIAAGEVVERPASVLKECVENALDAKAVNIEVYLDNGGKERLVIIDDGFGINADDLPKTVLRHATSKIAQTEDLFHLQQYGFRGEALAAVSSVSNFTIKSRAEAVDETFELTVSAGRVGALSPTSGNPGTTVTITKLFAPTPARLEYLKSDEAEYRACLKELYGFALGHPEVSFKVFKNDKLSLDYPATSSTQRVAQVLKKLAADLCPVTFSTRDLNIVGHVSEPGAGLSHRNQQYFLVNGRRIEDPRLAYAVREAYVQTCGIEKHLHPAFVLDLKIDPILVDVNVHPRKLEVKFAEPGQVFAAVKQAVMESLETASYQSLPNSSRPPSMNQQRETVSLPLNRLKPTPSQLKGAYHFNQRLTTATTVPSFAERNQQMNFSAPAPAVNTEAEAGKIQTPLVLIGQAENKYIVAQSSDGLYFFDQHALHERQRFEQFWQAYKAQPVTSQPLLVSMPIPLDESDVSLLHEHQNTLKKLGFELAFPSDEQVLVQAVPELLAKQDLASLLGVCVDFLQQGLLGEHALDQMMRNLLEYKACRGAVMFGDALSREEMEKLIADFDRTDWKLLCPHGRPNHFFMPFAELDKKFHR